MGLVQQLSLIRNRTEVRGRDGGERGRGGGKGREKEEARQTGDTQGLSVINVHRHEQAQR